MGGDFSKFCKGDSDKMAGVEEIGNGFPSLQMCVDHARGLIVVSTDDEKKMMFPGGRGIPPVAVFLWAMNEAENSPDPCQRARWYEYRSRRRVPPALVEALVSVGVVVPAGVKQVIVHSDSEGKSSEDEEEEKPGADVVVEMEDDNEQEQLVVEVEDDSKGQVVQQLQLPADDDLYMVAPGIPRPGDMSMTIKAEIYISVGIRHSDRIEKMKEMQK